MKSKKKGNLTRKSLRSNLSKDLNVRGLVLSMHVSRASIRERHVFEQ